MLSDNGATKKLKLSDKQKLKKGKPENRKANKEK